MSVLLMPAHAQQDALDPLVTNCEGFAGDPAAGTPQFVIRDLQNIYCSEQRHGDLLQHPVNVLRQGPLYGADPYREPELHDGIRFRHDAVTIAGAAGDVFLPCNTEAACPNMPKGLSRFEPPYPVVIALHGAASDKDHLWWATQPLAERGYFVVTVNGTGNALPFDVLNWLHSPANIYAADLDLTRVGITGHSLGAENSTRTQGDNRVSAIIGWDNCNSPAGCTNSPGSRLHDKGAAAKTPTLFITADYSGFPGYAQPRTSVPSALRLTGFGILHDNGVDTMLITPRATTHLDWAGSFTFGNRYNEMTSNHFNLAWFDRYLKGKLVLNEDGDVVTFNGRTESQERTYRQAIAKEAFDRLVATSFDATVDTHNISQGFYSPAQAAASQDPLLGGNVPYKVEGLPIADRLSFYYRSVCFISAPDYVLGNGQLGDALFARGDTTAEGNIRMQGCPVVLTNPNADSDGDGVADSIDQCPATPAGIAVDATGCPIVTGGDFSVSLTADPTEGDVTNDPLLVTFTSTASNADGAVQYVYYYGDGSNSGTTSASSRTHNYDKAGTYTARVVAVDADQNTAESSVVITTTTTVTIDPDPTVDAVLVVNSTGTRAPATFTFDASGSTAPDGATYSFDFGDGSTVQTSTEDFARHSYPLAGDYTVTLTVTSSSDSENTDTAVAQISVGSGQGTTVQLVVSPTTAKIGENVTFDARSSISAEGTTITGYTFHFDDESAPVTRSVNDFGADAGVTVHKYTNAGSFTPSVTVTDSANGSQTKSLNVKVNPGAVTPPVTAAPTSGGGALGLLILFPLFGAAALRRRRYS